jgi:type I restriction enzyme R subunit
MHTMYVDKPMRGHGLMQAIARVNRVFKDKPGGLVVDYLGLADQLIAAGVKGASPGDPAQPSDDEIIAEVHDHWHEAKQRFDKARLIRALSWMRENDLIPSGLGPRTQKKDTCDAD